MVTKLTIILFAFFSIAGRHSSENDTGTACRHYYSQTLKKNVYTTTDIEPEFPGGQVACLRFFNRHMRIPKDMIDNEEVPNLASMSKMKFIVDTDGQIINPVVHDKTDTTRLNSFEKELLRLIKLMPKWEPGICEGKKVAVEINRRMFTCIRIETTE
jgi:hypothetical protein